jgi:hypothetical protein
MAVLNRLLSAWRHPAVLRSAAVLCALLGSGVPAHAQVQDEQRLRAAMVYNLMLFVEWPAEALPATELQFCVVTENPDVSRAFSALAGKQIRNRALQVQRRGLLAALDDCQAVYLDGLGSGLVADKLGRLGRLPILTSASAPSAGAMIDLALTDNRLVFDVSAAALRDAQLSLASRVMQLARTVHR